MKQKRTVGKNLAELEIEKQVMEQLHAHIMVYGGWVNYIHYI